MKKAIYFNNVDECTREGYENVQKGLKFIAEHGDFVSQVPAYKFTEGFAPLLDRMGESSATLEDFKAKVWVYFGNAPKRILNRLSKTKGVWNTAKGRKFSIAWGGMVYATGENLVEFILAEREREKIKALTLSKSNKIPVSLAHLTSDVRFGKGPELENWDSIGDSDTSYIDYAWTTSEEITPGVYLETAHACLGDTRQWFTIIID